ncbi:hypothetical protein BCV70DRAFT_27205 [Testicularia cyperi]|uniref:Uncharacterized protein n=1 Tax=Testicularia cyperi TaxID=1882483 RepID=A0A317XKC2_9BASI|nr:hypothetical protein BCV70DRAFT_27205 [Testicularia cyperi]
MVFVQRWCCLSKRGGEQARKHRALCTPFSAKATRRSKVLCGYSLAYQTSHAINRLVHCGSQLRAARRSSIRAGRHRSEHQRARKHIGEAQGYVTISTRCISSRASLSNLQSCKSVAWFPLCALSSVCRLSLSVCGSIYIIDLLCVPLALWNGLAE